jgi:hypothetical protein
MHLKRFTLHPENYPTWEKYDRTPHCQIYRDFMDNREKYLGNI